PTTTRSNGARSPPCRASAMAISRRCCRGSRPCTQSGSSRTWSSGGGATTWPSSAPSARRTTSRSTKRSGAPSATRTRPSAASGRKSARPWDWRSIRWPRPPTTACRPANATSPRTRRARRRPKSVPTRCCANRPRSWPMPSPCWATTASCRRRCCRGRRRREAGRNRLRSVPGRVGRATRGLTARVPHAGLMQVSCMRRRARRRCRGSGRLLLLRLVALHRVDQDLLRLLGVAPAFDLDPLALFQILVVLEEVTDALEPVGADLVDVVDVGIALEDLAYRHRQQLLVAAGLVGHLQHAHRAAADHRAGHQ